MILSLCATGMFAMSACSGSSPKQEKTPAIDLANLDTTTAPGADFYQYACGGWIKNNPLKPEYSRFGSFDKLNEMNQEQLRSLVEELAYKTQKAGSVADKIGRFYVMGLDSAKLNEDGFNPIKDELKQIAALKDKTELSREIAYLQKEGMSPYFSFGISGDEKNSSMNIVQLYQSGLGMGDRDYYLVKDSTNQKIYAEYEKYIVKLFTMTGKTPAQAAAAAASVLKIEKGIAEVSSSREELRDSEKNYHKMKVEEFLATNDMLDWKTYFETRGAVGLKELDVKQLEFYKGLAKFLKTTTIDEQKDYLAFNLINEAASFLSDDFSNASFDFYGRVMSGKQEQKPRWKRALSVVNGELSEAVGKMYVEKYFPASSKEKMLTLVHNLQKALGERIKGLTWMSEATKAKALDKLAAYTIKIGYPDKWRDYTALQIKNDSYWSNVRRANQFDNDYMMSFYNKPVDKTLWGMSPQTVNAYYNPTTNEICFPAAILQPPFFNPDADDAVNYGAIGVVIGHEMTHGFDDEGRHYDKDGNLVDWWTAEDAKRFNEKADILANQYSQIIVLDSVHANGRYTLGENIADHGGLLVAHQAYENTLKGKQVPAKIDGFTNEQRFYLAYAALWAQNIRNEEILHLTKIDPHSLAKWRVNAALRNIDAFYAAFGIKEGDKMYLAPSERVVIW